MNAQKLIDRYNKGDRDFTGADLTEADLSGAILKGADLYRADLKGADLEGANLEGADLRGSILMGAILMGAILTEADLRGSILMGAILMGAILTEADLSGANLTGANLTGADLKGATNLTEVPFIENIHKKVWSAVSAPNALDMSNWHTCETTHCRAGWVITLAGEEGKKLEEQIGTNAAAALIYYQSDPHLERVPNWFASNEEALHDIARLAGKL